jgi:hypothetical protein
MKLSRQQLFQLFVIAAFPVHVWAIFRFLEQVPAWVLRYTLWELAAQAGYQLLFALFESAVVFLVLLALLRLFARWLGGRLVAAAAMFMLATTVVNAWAHLDRVLVRTAWVFLLLAIYAAGAAAGIWFVRRYEKFATSVVAFVDRLAVLSVLYFFLDAVGIVLVIISQFRGAVS